MKKRFFALIIAVFMLIPLFCFTASADTGPKPSVNISFSGFEGQRYFVTLLADREGRGPWNTENGYEDWCGDRDAWDAFKSFDAPEGWYFVGYMEDCTETHSFAWTYYPPDIFRVLIYYPDSGEFLLSDEAYERYAFDSYYTVSAENTGFTVESAREQYVAKEAFGFIARLVITLAIELAIAAGFMKLNKKSVLVIILANVVTQSALNLIIMSMHASLDLALIVYGITELGIFVAEALTYRFTLPKYSDKKVRTWLYALCANVVSFAAGLGLAILLPGLF